MVLGTSKWTGRKSEQLSIPYLSINPLLPATSLCQDSNDMAIIDNIHFEVGIFTEAIYTNYQHQHTGLIFQTGMNMDIVVTFPPGLISSGLISRQGFLFFSDCTASACAHSILSGDFSPTLPCSYIWILPVIQYACEMSYLLRGAFLFLPSEIIHW